MLLENKCERHLQFSQQSEKNAKVIAHEGPNTIVYVSYSFFQTAHTLVQYSLHSVPFTCHIAVDFLWVDRAASIHIDVVKPRCVSLVLVRLTGLLVNGCRGKQKNNSRGQALLI